MPRSSDPKSPDQTSSDQRPPDRRLPALPFAVPPALQPLAALTIALVAGPMGAGLPAAAEARRADPIPPAAPPISDAVALAAVPDELRQQTGLQLVLDRSRRQLLVLEDGELRRRFPAAVGMVGWETPAGRFQVMEMQSQPVWEHPQTGKRIGPGPANPLGSRWIGFHRDCNGRKGWDGEQVLDVRGCVVAGFHGTPHRWTVGRAISHGCVRLYDEDVRALYDLVQIGTPVTVLP